MVLVGMSLINYYSSKDDVPYTEVGRPTIMRTIVYDYATITGKEQGEKPLMIS